MKHATLLLSVLLAASIHGQARRYGYGFPITASPAVARVNIRILPDCRQPVGVWSNQRFLNAIYAANGTFPVHLWRIRKNVATKVTTWRVPAAPCAVTPRNVFFQERVPVDFQFGDIAVVEYSPGMFVARSAISPGAFVHPQGSQVTNRSGDAVTLDSFRVELDK